MGIFIEAALPINVETPGPAITGGASPAVPADARAYEGRRETGRPMGHTSKLEHLMQDLELDWVERNESLSKDKERIYQAICAFMNDMPAHGHSGLIFIGVSDDGVPSGLAVTDDLLTTLAQMRSDGNVQPIPDLEVQPRMLRGVRVAVIEVHPVSHAPARFKGQTWIGVGPTRAIATPDQERRRTEKRVSAAQTFDQHPCLHASLADLHLTPFREEYLPRVVSPEVLVENHRTVTQQLASLRFFDPACDVPTYAGLIDHYRPF